jgi:alpha-glucuronidase
MEFLEELGKHLISVAIIGALIVWLFKELIKKWLTNDVEKFRAKLEYESHVAKIQFSKLYEERGVVIKEIYSILQDYNFALKSIVRHSDKNYKIVDKDKKLNKLSECIDLGRKLERYYAKNKIFFEQELCLKIDKLIKKSTKIVQFGTLKSLPEGLINVDMPKDEIKEIINNDIPEIQMQIEEVFRKLLGIDNK